MTIWLTSACCPAVQLTQSCNYIGLSDLQAINAQDFKLELVK